MRPRLFIAGLLSLFLALSSLATAETIQKGGLRVSLEGEISPKKLPRAGEAPVRVSVSTEIAATNGKELPQLTRISIAINRHGHLDPTGLPICTVSEIQPATTEKALEACRGSLVGQGYFAATVALTRQVSFPSKGKLYAFNGTYEGKPAILAHVYGTNPVPTSFTLPFVIGHAKGTFATTLTAELPRARGSVVTGLGLDLRRTFTYRGKARSFASAGCPAPAGFPGASFPFAKVSYGFAGGRSLASTLVRSCKARR
jgi:hypothetical protein